MELNQNRVKRVIKETKEAGIYEGIRVKIKQINDNSFELEFYMDDITKMKQDRFFALDEKKDVTYDIDAKDGDLIAKASVKFIEETRYLDANFNETDKYLGVFCDNLTSVEDYISADDYEDKFGIQEEVAEPVNKSEILYYFFINAISGYNETYWVYTSRY